MIRQLLTATAVAILTLSPIAAGTATAESPLYKKALPGVAWVVTEKPDAKKPGFYEGTAWVLDKEQRLMVTNHHVVNGAKTITLFFPQKEGGELMTDRDWYAREGRRTHAKVVVADPKRDLAVIQVDGIPAGARALPLAADSPEIGDEVFTVGNPGHDPQLWWGNQSQVEVVDRKPLPTREGGRFNGYYQETRLAVSPGASGSPVLNAAGEVVGVLFAVGPSQEGKRTRRAYSVDVAEIRTVVEAARKKLAEATESGESERAIRARG